jgi:hypothetical protein
MWAYKAPVAVVVSLGGRCMHGGSEGKAWDFYDQSLIMMVISSCHDL